MCLLTFLPGGVLPDGDALHHGAAVNGDGHGFAIVTDGRLIVQRGMNAEVMIETFTAARRQHPTGPALFHSRFTTHGDISIGNCHPFSVGGDVRTVVAHNGVLPRAVQPRPGDRRSDTRIAAEDFLPSIGSLHVRRTRLRIERWMTPANKIVILTVDRRFTDHGYILNEGAGTWADGIWYSNDGYLPPTRHRWTFGDDEWETWHRDGVDRCGYCHGIVHADDDACQECGWCLDCGEMPHECYCHPLTTRSRDTGERASTVNRR